MEDRCPLISVIMSCYNETDIYLQLSIESILNQTYKNIEFIIINDNPFNESLRLILDKYRQKDSRIILVHNEMNLGLTKSLNKGIEIAKGIYCARMDADDVSFPKRLESELNYLLAHKLDLVGCMTRRIDENGIVINHLSNISQSPRKISKKILYDNCVAHPTWLLKKAIYDNLSGYREIHSCEDYDFLLRATISGYSIGICNECLLSYRVNLNGISRSNGLTQFLSARFLQKNMHRLNDVNQSEINQYLQGRISENNNRRFEIANQLLDRALILFRNRNLLFVYYAIKACVISRFTFLKFIQLLKMHTFICLS